MRILNEKDYPSPGRLRYERGIITNNNKKGNALLWNRHVLTDMLYNIAYIGHLAQGRSASCLHKGIPFTGPILLSGILRKIRMEPIVDKKLWDQVQEINQALSRAAKENHGKYADLPKRQNPYGSLLRCADCGRVIKQVRSYNTSKKSGTQSITRINAPDILNLDRIIARKEVSGLLIWTGRYWKLFGFKWRCF